MLKVTRRKTLGWLAAGSVLILIMVIFVSATFGAMELLAGLGPDGDQWLVLAGSALVLAAPVLRRLR